jgi:hypothetical protein
MELLYEVQNPIQEVSSDYEGEFVNIYTKGDSAEYSTSESESN